MPIFAKSGPSDGEATSVVIVERRYKGAPRTAARGAAVFSFYRAVWRWHFYAGLLILPFLITLSITGAIYLFREEVDQIVHSDFMLVTPTEEQRLAPAQIIEAALAAQPGRAVKYTTPATDTRSTEVTVQPETGGRMAVYVDQYTGKVLEVRPDRSTFAWTVRYLHSFRYFGPTPRMIIEIVGGWSILMVVTGVYLWWPRGQTGGVVSVRGTPARRVFWRDLHAVSGILVGGVLVFLAVTGMPWSSVWGARVNQWANGTNFGYPSGVRVDVPMSGQRLDDVAKTAWSLEQARIPESPAPEAGVQAIGVDAAVARLDELGLHRGYTVALPSSETGVYSGSVYPDDLTFQRVIHLDQYSGEPLVDMTYADYGPLGRWLEFVGGSEFKQLAPLLRGMRLVELIRIPASGLARLGMVPSTARRLDRAVAKHNVYGARPRYFNKHVEKNASSRSGMRQSIRHLAEPYAKIRSVRAKLGYPLVGREGH